MAGSLVPPLFRRRRRGDGTATAGGLDAERLRAQLGVSLSAVALSLLTSVANAATTAPAKASD